MLPFLVLFLLAQTALQQKVNEIKSFDPFFVEPANISVHEGERIIFHCEANIYVDVNLCKWTWRKMEEETTENEIMIKEYPAFGELNNECNLEIKDVMDHHQGIWTCILEDSNHTTYRSSPSFLYIIKEIGFKLEPQNVTVIEHTVLHLSCTTDDDVEYCQWKFRSSHDVPEQMILKEYKPGHPRNCSTIIAPVGLHHDGFWSCGAKKNQYEDYIYTDEAHVVVHDEKLGMNFTETPVDTVFSIGSNGSMQCITQDKVQQCRWFWQPQGYTNDWQVMMREFPPEDGYDCSLHFKDITTEPEGQWMCAVLPYNSIEYIQTKPVTLRIKTLIDFSVLTRAVMVAEGMETSLRCQTDADVEECRWRWHQLGEANEPSLVVTVFPPAGPLNQDCSIQFTNMLMEQQGVWVCGVRLRNESDFKEAMPTTVSLKPAARIRIIEGPKPKVIAEKEYLFLNCISSASVNQCTWEWTPSNASLKPDTIRFAPDSKNSRNCSLWIENVEMRHDGYWRCTVQTKREKSPGCKTAGSIAKATTDPIKLTVVKPPKIEFLNVPNVVHVSPGSTRRLICRASHQIESCKWKFLGKTEIIKAEFSPVNENDCTLNLNDLQVSDSGSWQCGVKNIGQYHYNWAEPITLNVLHTELITTSYWISEPTNQLNLACHLDTQIPLTTLNCQWLHPPTNINISTINNLNDSYTAYFDESNGDCILEFKSQSLDLGLWQCFYTVDTENGTWNVGEAKFLVIPNPNNLNLRWVVGILAAITVIIAITLGLVIIYGCPWNTTAKGKSSSKDTLGNKPPPVPSKNSARYTEEPGKINFHFQEAPNVYVDLTHPPVPKPNHVYERVGRFSSPALSKSLQQLRILEALLRNNSAVASNRSMQQIAQHSEDGNEPTTVSTHL